MIAALLDEFYVNPFGDVQEQREEIASFLCEPLDPVEAFEYKREHWGTGIDAVRQAEKFDQMEAVLGFKIPTYGEDDD